MAGAPFNVRAFCDSGRPERRYNRQDHGHHPKGGTLTSNVCFRIIQ
jgi:hypothetical protein